MKKLTKTTREKLLRGVLIASVLLFLTSAIVLWENRRGTPGEPADFYYTVLRDGVELNRSEMARNRAAGCPHYLIVDLSDTILTGEERDGVVRRLGEKYPELTVLDLPMEEGEHFWDTLAAEVLAATGTSVDDMTTGGAGFSPLTMEVKSPLPPREQFGVEPITVSCLMHWDGWKGRSNAVYLHYPLAGWRWTLGDRGMEYQIS